MTLWLLLALMTAAAIFAVLWPLGRSGVPAGGRGTAIYADQLREIERDLASGSIEADEAGAARIEVSRRLLAAAETEQAAVPVSRIGLRRAVAVVALTLLPLVSISVYLRYGSPALANLPRADRDQPVSASTPLETLVAQVEAHLEKNQADGRGWDVIAPALAKLGRFDDAARAYRNSLRLNGDGATRHSDLGEVLAASANGIVTAEAKAEFEQAVASDAGDVKARYFLGLAAQQDGRSEQAGKLWRDLLADAPADAPWKPLVAQALTQVTASSAPTLSDDDVAATKDMNGEQRTAMIRGMVDRLAARLEQKGDDVEGWLRLLRAYMVLGERDKARAAMASARQAMRNDPDALTRINDGLRELGLDG